MLKRELHRTEHMARNLSEIRLSRVRSFCILRKVFQMLKLILKNIWLAGLALLMACAANSTPEQSIVGRWHRVSAAGPGDPNELSGEYVEFRADGTLLWLIKDEENFWLGRTAAYTVPSANEIEVTGSCYRGYERFTCAKNFALEINGETLKITGELGEAVYQRVGEVGQELPPTLAPPVATPTL